MAKEELNLEELDKANGGFSSGKACLVITYKDNETDTETKEQRNYTSTYSVAESFLEMSAEMWCLENDKIYVSYTLEVNGKQVSLQ